ncbi:3-methyladenine DNA glycosylase [Campylobacter geochelonis]|uniref:3-methyladenine DNA glycosylase n=1 Tax=Campylobacter geochelonis TaxID=1780362 RepID=UPI0007709D27|nr:3-methyladenine DNA glycosylase [Campylobacter geochelonis]CZE47591.1 endonuclease III [Campylobacter geochelonis]CZE50194.1 endonuclease III [Campylobacter geochelonis]
MTSTELFCALYDDIKLANVTWWPNYGSFEVVVSAVLTQQTKWENVEKSLLNLAKFNTLSLEEIAKIDVESLANLIKPSGFYNNKAKRLNALCKAVVSEFGDFESFKEYVSREWLISQKGIGAETCDAILCYACEREEMVVDSYALRILGYFGYEFESYDEAKEWLSELDFSVVYAMVLDMSEARVCALYHGLIVEFCKKHLKGKEFSDKAKDIFKEIS